MKYLATLTVTLLLVAVTCGQSMSNITGIKVKESSFDPQTRTVKLVFINDSTADITAWAYCVHAKNAPGDYPAHGSCLLTDTLGPVINHQINLKKKPSASEPDCGGCRVIHPGQEYELGSNFSGFPEVINASIELTVVIFSDGTSSATQAGQQHLTALAQGRQTALQIAQNVIAMGNKILTDPNEKNPVVTMIAALKSRTHLAGIPGMEARSPAELEGVTIRDSSGKILTEWPDGEELVNFKRPGWRQGDNREFVPDNQREYLQQFLADEQISANYLSKHQIHMPAVQQ